jgi:hypothetical protein
LIGETAVPLGATFTSSDGGGVVVLEVNPPNAGALPIRLAFDYLIHLDAGHLGGSWDGDYSEEMVEDLADIVGAIVAGRVSEVFAPWRSRVEVVLNDGEVVAETGYGGMAAILPMPYWPRWGRRVQYSPYGT